MIAFYDMSISIAQAFWTEVMTEVRIEESRFLTK
jgi:hypothetical protein